MSYECDDVPTSKGVRIPLLPMSSTFAAKILTDSNLHVRAYNYVKKCQGNVAFEGLRSHLRLRQIYIYT